MVLIGSVQPIYVCEGIRLPVKNISSLLHFQDNDRMLPKILAEAVTNINSKLGPCGLSAGEIYS